MPKIWAQDVMCPYRPFISFGVGVSYASINNWQESTRLHLNPGVRAIMTFQLKELFSLDASTSIFAKHNSLPVFENIHSWNAELNGNIMLPLENGTGYFKVLVGAAYLDWKGIYSGVGLKGRNSYQDGDLIHYKFVEGNIGMGFTQQIGNRSFLDFALILRVSSNEKNYGITDTSLELGYRFAPRFGKKEIPGSGKLSETNTKKTKTEHGIPKGKYKWLKKKRS